MGANGIHSAGMGFLLRLGKHWLGKMVIVDVQRTEAGIALQCSMAEFSFTGRTDCYILEGMWNFVVIANQGRRFALLIPRRSTTGGIIERSAVELATGLQAPSPRDRGNTRAEE